MTHVARPSRNTFESVHVSNGLLLATNSQNCPFLAHFLLFYSSCWAFIKLHFGGKSFGESLLNRRIRWKEVQMGSGRRFTSEFPGELNIFFALFSRAGLLDWFVLITVFCNLPVSVRRSKYCLELSITWGRLKISIWLFHSCTIFEAYLINSLWFSEVKFFTFFPS